MDRYQGRVERLRRALRGDKVGAFLVTHEPNVAYLTGFGGDSSALLLEGDRALLISDGRYTTQLREECPSLETHIRPVGQTLIAGVVEVVAKLGIERLGFEAEALNVADYRVLESKLPGLALAPLSGRVEGLRMFKDAEEMRSIRQAVAAAGRAFAMVRAGLRDGDSEKDVADALEGYLRRCGATGSSFPPIVAVGPRSALPHARPVATSRVGSADFLLIDWGAWGDAAGRPYKSDLTRMVVTGKVSTKFEAVYRAVLEAQGRGIAAVRPGARARDVDAAARDYLEGLGYGRHFGHGLGHGIGLEIHEGPRLKRETDLVLRPGMVLTIEPGVYLPGWGGVRIEDDVLVTAEGHEVFDGPPKGLDSVRL